MQRRMEWLFRVGLAMILGALAAGCGQAAQAAVLQSDKPRITSDASAAERAELVAGNNAFAFELYQRLRAEGSGNLFYSPYSISQALAMTYAGARGETEAQMAATLHFTLPQARLHAAFNAVDGALAAYDAGEEEDGFQLHIANALWGQAGYPFRDSFLDTLAENYGAGLRTLDFAHDPEGARRAINAWVAEQTEDKIRDLIREGLLDRLVRLVLTNAIYFNAKWQQPFEADDTQDEAFHRLDGTTVQVPMMYQASSFAYAESDGTQAVELRYRGAPMGMLFILPAEGRFEEVEGAFSAEELQALVDKLEWQAVRLSVPKFTFESEFNLSDALKAMGMPAAFDGSQADFSGMAESRELFISDVVHKAFVAVDEEGTEAAAATAVIMKLTAAIGEDAVEMRLDRPFLFLIRDTEAGNVLFAGRVMNPEE